MSVEAAVFILRLLAGLSLLGFLAVLFVIVWRSMRQVDRQLATTRMAYGYLTSLPSNAAQPNQVEKRFPLHAITTLGRSASNTIVVDNDFASAQHARIVLEGGQWWLEDRGSRNGTRLNDVAIDQPTILADSDVVGIGNLRYRFTLTSNMG